jgi:hypothetical protein
MKIKSNGERKIAFRNPVSSFPQLLVFISQFSHKFNLKYVQEYVNVLLNARTSKWDDFKYGNTKVDIKLHPRSKNATSASRPPNKIDITYP